MPCLEPVRGSIGRESEEHGANRSELLGSPLKANTQKAGLDDFEKHMFLEQYIMGSSGCFSAPLILSRSNTIHFLRFPPLLFEFSLVLLNKAGCYLLVRDS